MVEYGDIEVRTQGGITGPLSFHFPVPTKPFRRYEELLPEPLAKMVGGDAEDIVSILSSELSGVSHPTLIRLRDYLLSLTPVAMVVCDEQTEVEPYPEIQKQMKSIESLQLQDLDIRERIKAVTESVEELLKAERSMSISESVDRIRKQQEFYDASYIKKAAEIDSLPPATREEAQVVSGLVLQESNTEVEIWLPFLHPPDRQTVVDLPI